jgi:hypothetical protein
MTTKSKQFAAPAHLEKTEKTLFDSIRAEFGIADSGGISLLCAACESHQRARKCRESIDAMGEISALGKPHPLLTTERNSRKDFISAINALGLDIAPTGTIGRPTNNARRIN